MLPCRLGLQKCCRCDVVFGGSDPVIRTSSAIYHPDCFRCLACNRQILTGDEFSNFEGNLLCKADLDIVVTSGVERLSASSSENAAIIRSKVGSTDGTTPSGGAFNNNNNDETKGNPIDPSHTQYQYRIKRNYDDIPILFLNLVHLSHSHSRVSPVGAEIQCSAYESFHTNARLRITCRGNVM